jgi:hypothetical protein
MSTSVQMFTNDPSKFHLLATEVKLQMIQAGIATVNVMAAVGRKGAVKNVQEKFINRNTFTTRQIQFTPMPESKYVKIAAIQATLGALDTAPWLARQEEGGKHTPSRGQTLAIPTDRARGGSIRNAVAAAMRVSRLGKRRRVGGNPRKFKQKTKGGKVITRKPKNYNSQKALKVARAWVAFEKGLLVPVGDTKGQRNLFAVTSFYKTRDRVAFKLEQVYKFDRPFTVTKAEPWLLPASEKVASQCQAIFNAQINKLGK